MGDIAESRRLFQTVDLLLRRLALDHLQEYLAHLQRFVLLAANDHAKHDICRSLRDGAAVADERAVRDRIAVQLQLEKNIVAAAGIDALKHDVRVGHVMLELRMKVVLRQYLIIKASIFHNPCAPSTWTGCQAAGRSPPPCYKTRDLRARWTDASDMPAAAGRNGAPRGSLRRRSQEFR